MRTVLNQPQKTFPEALADVAKAADDMRDALIALMPSAPVDKAAWLETMSGKDTHERLAYAMTLAKKNEHWLTTAIATILEMVQQHAPGLMKDVRDGGIAGQANAEMSCTCGQCETCGVRAKHGDEWTRDALAKAFQPKEPGRIVGTDGKTLQ